MSICLEILWRVRIQFTDTGSTVNNKSLLEGSPLVGTEDFSFEIQDALEQKLKMDLIVNKSHSSKSRYKKTGDNTT